MSRIGGRINDHDRVNTRVSQASVGWHLAHSLITLETIADLLVSADPEKPHGRINLTGRVILTLGWIPRGRGKAPKVARPKEETTTSDLEERLARVRQKADQLDALGKDQYFRHPYFGDLNLTWALKFMKVHTRHHLKIVDDILK